MTVQSINHKNIISYQTATKLLTEKESKKNTHLKEAATYSMSQKAKNILDRLKADDHQKESQNIEETASENEEAEVETEEEIPLLSKRDREKLEKLFQKYSATIMAGEIAKSYAVQAENHAEYLAEQQAKLKKCLKIYQNLKGGGRVPNIDQAYLQKMNFSMYQLAMTARMLEERKEKQEESVLDEDDIKAMGGEVTNSEPTYTGAEIEPSPELDILRGIGDVLMGKEPLSSLEGMVDLSNYDTDNTNTGTKQSTTRNTGKTSGTVSSGTSTVSLG